MAETKTTKHGLTVAKATKQEFKRVWGFVHAMENLFESRSFFSSEEDWREWDDTDPDKRLMLRIEKELIADGEATWDGHPENDKILFAFIKHKWREVNHSGSVGRILFDCETLIDNCCDPKLDHLEFKPSIMYAEQRALEKIEKIIQRGEKRGLPADKIIERIKKRIEDEKKED